MDSRVETARVSAAAAGVVVYGLTLNEWVAAVTLLYLVLQIIVLSPKAYHTIREWMKR